MKEYLKDREPTPKEYRDYHIARLDFVHMSDTYDPRLHNPREKIIIARMQLLRSAHIVVKLLTDLFEELNDIRGLRIAVGGGLEDGCCEIRAGLIQEAGGIPVIDLSLTTKY